ncbi:hypothetical protein ABMA28_010093 [Loxostege sticticalis]|uniref:Fatty acid desaturase domain-containing protein n=1 Tax=Loxostege sticticalis TaxID=481309 RepID=A0ABD0S9N9_LOXSC
MAPHSKENSTQQTKEEFFEEKTEELNQKRETALKNNKIIIYITILALTYYHLAGFYGLYLTFKSVKWATIGFGFLLYFIGILGVTAGAHRLWSHKSYKAKLPLQIILMLFQSVAFQKSKTVQSWVRDHRLHHKFSDTDGDPHNANRGFFFSHMGWLISVKTDEVIKGEKSIDISDIITNPVLRFQKKYAFYVIGICCFVLPTAIPMYFWGETFNNAWHFNFLRFLLSLHMVFCINSVAHKWGYRPYDKNILPAENALFSFAVLGEGFHNYHHCFPWDYQTSELGNKALNFTTWFIDFCAGIGWAYDLKTASEEVVKSRADRTGDGKFRMQ